MENSYGKLYLVRIILTDGNIRESTSVTIDSVPDAISKIRIAKLYSEITPGKEKISFSGEPEGIALCEKSLLFL